MAAETDITELETKSQAFDYLMTMDEFRDEAEKALERTMFKTVSQIAV